MEKIEIGQLKEEHVDQTADVITRSFLGMNDIWKSYNPQYDDIYPVIRGKILPAVHHGWSFIVTKNKQVVGASITYDIVDYLNAPTMPHASKLFNTLGKYGSELEAALKKQNFKRGQAAYTSYAVIDPQYAGQGLSLQFWWMAIAIGKVCGWKYYYTRASNPQSYRMLKKIGMKQIDSITVNEPQVKGGNQKLYLMKYDLTKDYPTYSMVLQATAKPKL